MASAWDKYVNGFLVNKQLPGGKWLQKITEAAAITDQSGNTYAATPSFKLGAYKHVLDDGTGKPKEVPIDEKMILAKVVMTGSTEGLVAGVRINGQKHMLVNYDATKKLAYFAKPSGGACAMASKKTIVYAAYNNTLNMSDGKAQNPGVCNEVVEKLAALLIKNGS